jgi:hypothetical protein
MSLLCAGVAASVVAPVAEVDRFEGTKAVLVLPGGRSCIVDRADLPDGVQEGDTLGPGWRARPRGEREPKARAAARLRARLGRMDRGGEVKLQ